MKLSVFLGSAAIVGCLGTAPTAATFAADKSKPVDFNRDVLPILSDNCFMCHGPDAKKRDADLRLDTEDGIFAASGEGHRIVTPGNSAASELYQVVSSTDDFELMPPSTSNLKLTPTQVDLIKRWIDQGASYGQHWAYVAPQRPAVPEVKNKSWTRNPIDNFILARLQAEGLQASPEADRATLLRRVSFDLTGLPPTPTELETFLRDKSSNAYEKQVNRLLASPRYGENMARMWLDLARYADSHGGDVDPLRGMWPWRDWVINAYNRNLPYDQFTIKQLAGDLLPGATLEDRIATGFNRNNPADLQEDEDKVPVDGESRANYVADRVSTTGTTWLGLTVGCARCHDHKYDPIKQRDFYRLAAYFNNVPEFSLGDHNGNTEPVVAIPSPEQVRQMGALESEIHATLVQLPEKEIANRENQWRTSAAATIPQPPKNGLRAYYEFDGTLLDSSGHGQDARLKQDQLEYLGGAVGKAVVFNGTTEVDFGNLADFDRTTPFAISLWTNPKRPEKQILLQKRDASPNWTGMEIALEDPNKGKRLLRLVVRLASRWPDDAMEIRSKELVLHSTYVVVRNLGTPGHHLVVNYDGSGKAAGLKVFLDGKLVATEITKDQLTGSSKTSASLSIGDKQLGLPFTGLVDDLRLYNRVLPDADIDNLYMDVPARGLVNELHGKPVAEIHSLRDHQEIEQEFPDDEANQPQKVVDAVWLNRQQARLSHYFLSRGASQSIRTAYAELKQLRGQQSDLERFIPTTMIMSEMDPPQDTFVLGRGQFYNKTEKVTAGVPAFLLPPPKGAPANRLGLARWLVDPQNPLTARVEVNRYWQNYFGAGIVKTAEDFGSQGEPPSHSQLLDWLATEFVRTGWDIKAMQRLIVLSATYRQSSKLTPQLRESDPENRLLARGPRVRLSAEQIRDSALAMSGLLAEKVGGPSVYPYQPEGLWSERSVDAHFSASYKQATGTDLYRRSVYTIWRRGNLAPSFMAFDAPSREMCTARRNLTNTPLQALVLMDDPTYVEASRVLAQRTLLEAGTNPGKRLEFLFGWALERKPDSTERAVLLQEAQRVSAQFQQNPAVAQKLLSVGEMPTDPKIDPAELAAWTTVTRTVLNMDETITKQ